MNWTELLNSRVNEVFAATEGLLDHVDEGSFDWRPETGHNWMTMGQLLEHCVTACGCCMAGFVTGDWKMPDGTDVSEMSPEEMMPPADKMPTAKDLASVRAGLAADKKLSHEMIAKAGESDLATKMVTAPWMPMPLPLGVQLASMIGHLENHKAQLFFYLKSQGKPMHTGLLYGMPSE